MATKELSTFLSWHWKGWKWKLRSGNSPTCIRRVLRGARNAF